MAKKARIRWDVNNEELEKSNKLLRELQKRAGLTDEEVRAIGDSFEENNKSIQKNKSSFEDLGKTIAGLGIAAMVAGAAIEFGKLAIEIQKSRKEVALLTDLTGRELDKATAKIKALSTVWDKDFNEVLRAANTASKEFDVSITEALENINEGMLRGIDLNGEYLESMTEYSTFAQKAGLTMKQLNIVLQEQTKQGIFSDKGIDAIKEGQLSLQEMTAATVDAVEAIGMSADEITRDIESGVTTYFEVMQKIAQKTRELGNARVTGQVLADIYRGAGEDAGDYVLTLDQMGEEYAELNKEQQQFYDLQTKLINNQEDFNDALIASTKGIGAAWNEIKSNLLPVLTAFVELLAGSEFRVQKFREEFEEIHKGKVVLI
jgi:hypothetical protein